MLQWDRLGFTVNGKNAYPVSGEFHYFRVPAADWARRMRLFREAGGNCIATYIPWIIHEPEEGRILFGDVPNRDLARFLQTAQDEGLLVIVRPGPYQYSELVRDGLPCWLADDYPQALARDRQGKIFDERSISYLHPLFLEKARAYYRAVDEVLAPYMASRGGPVCMVQLDNELSGIHIWRGSLDYHPETMGFGRETGRYAQWLRAKYGTVESMNRAYQTDCTAFSDAMPRETESGRQTREYADFYAATLAEYAQTLAGWLREDGIDGPLCHNSAGMTMNTFFRETVDALGDDFLLGSDHYYTLSPAWPQNSPSPQYALKMFMSCELLAAMGMPPTVFEMPGGNLSDTPPILYEDLLACYRLNAALGMKAVNYYIYTGGPNFGDTGNTGEIYDYHAPVSADGEVRDTYRAMWEFGKFLRENAWMQRARREISVQVGFTWEETRFQEYAPQTDGLSVSSAWQMAANGALYALMATPFAPCLRPITGELDKNKPLAMVCPDCMSQAAQEATVRFIEAGGRALLLPVLPRYDENGAPCTILADYVGIRNVRPLEKPGEYVRMDGSENVYRTDRIYTADLPNDAAALAWDDRQSCPVGAQMRRGNGIVIWLGVQFTYSLFSHAKMLEAMLRRLGGRETVECSNRNLFTALWSDGKQRMLYVMNLYSGRQQTDIRVRTGDGWMTLPRLALSPMEVYASRI